MDLSGAPITARQLRALSDEAVANNSSLMATVYTRLRYTAQVKGAYEYDLSVCHTSEQGKVSILTEDQLEGIRVHLEANGCKVNTYATAVDAGLHITW